MDINIFLDEIELGKKLIRKEKDLYFTFSYLFKSKIREISEKQEKKIEEVLNPPLTRFGKYEFENQSKLKNGQEFEIHIGEGKGLDIYTKEKEVDGKIIEEEYLQESYTSFLEGESLRKVKLFKLEGMDDNICILKDTEIKGDYYYLLYNTDKNIYYSILYDYMKYSYRKQISGRKKAKTWVSKAYWSGNRKTEYEFNSYGIENGIEPDLWYDKSAFRYQIKSNVAAISFRISSPNLEKAYIQLSELLKQTNAYIPTVAAYDLLRNQHIFGERRRPKTREEIDEFNSYHNREPTELELQRMDYYLSEDDSEIIINDFLFSNDTYFRGFLYPELGFQGTHHYWKSKKPHKFVGRTHKGVRWGSINDYVNYDELNSDENYGLREDFLSLHRDFNNFTTWLSRQKKKYPNSKYEKLWLPYPKNYLIKNEKYYFSDLLMLNAIVVKEK